MDRKQFIRKLGVGTGAIFFVTCIGACSSSDSDDPNPNPNPPPGPGKLDFTFDVTTDSNLQANGWTVRNGAIIAKSGTGYVAYDSSCPHQGNVLTFNASNNTFPCSQQGPDHGSVFDINGSRIRGPATSNLRKYNTTLTGNNLRVFAS